MEIKDTTCKHCGSNEMNRYNEYLICKYCNTKYIIDNLNINKVEDPQYVCPKCGQLSSKTYFSNNERGVCFFCRTKMIKLQPEIDFEEVRHLSIQEEDHYRLLLQPREDFDQQAWLHRERMQQCLEKKHMPYKFNYRYSTDIHHPQCPHCGQYWTQKEKTFFKGEYWHCYFCDKDFKE